MPIENRNRAKKLLVPLAFCACLMPAISSGFALLLGILITSVFGNPYQGQTKKLTKPMLAWSIVGLGAGVNLMMILKAGAEGVLFTVVSLALTLALGYWLGRNVFKNSREMSALISVGTAICGGSAIAAVSSAIRAKDDSVSVSMGVVFILNAIALFLFPHLGHAIGLTQDQFGFWAALAIHDTSSVVGSTMQYGDRALEVGTTVKLVRALWIVPVTLFFARFFSSELSAADRGQAMKAGKPSFPWFILGFVAASALVTAMPILQPAGHWVEWLAKRTLVGTLFLIGTGLSIETLKRVGVNSLLHGVVLWILVAGASLIATMQMLKS